MEDICIARDITYLDGKYQNNLWLTGFHIPPSGLQPECIMILQKVEIGICSLNT